MEISLTDCLACSGCITSAETVLVQQQSIDEMMRVFYAQKVYKLLPIKMCIKYFLFSHLIATFYNLGP